MFDILATRKEFKKPVFVILTNMGLLSILGSFIALIIGVFLGSWVIIIPGMITPILFGMFSIIFYTRDDLDISVVTTIARRDIRAKQFLSVSLIINSNHRVKGQVFLETTDGLVPVLIPAKQVFLDGKRVSFLFLAPKRGKERIERAIIQFWGIPSFFYLEQRIVINEEIIVTPEPQRVKLSWTIKQRILEQLVSQISVPVKGRGYEFFALRDFQYGDEVKHIHWKASAKHNKLIVKEFEEPMMLRFLIIVDISLMMAGPKLEFVLSSVVELAEVISKSHHSIKIILQGNHYNKLISMTNSIKGFKTLSMELHSVKPEGTYINYQKLNEFIRSKKMEGSVCIILSDLEQKPEDIKDQLLTLKNSMQVLFHFATYSPGFGTMALSKVRDFQFYSVDQMLFRREILEPHLERIYNRRILEYKMLIDSRNARFKVIESFRTNILLELKEMLALYKNKKSEKLISLGEIL